MDQKMKEDKEKQLALLQSVMAEAESFLARREDGIVSPVFPGKEALRIGEEGMGAQGALDCFRKEYAPYVALNTGPRYYGFVVGGVTPAALAGDWLTSLYDQNAFGMAGYLDRQIEMEAVSGLVDLLGLHPDMVGSFTSGATMATAAALAVAREWAAQAQGKTADDGVYGLERPVILSGTAHPSVYKGLSIVGLGRNSLTVVDHMEGREAVDVRKLEAALAENRGRPCIVIANMGTANTGDVDDLKAISALKEKYDFFLHVDGAIGIVAAASEQYRPLFEGILLADSVTIDCHKWLNVAYDCAIALVRKEYREYQYRAYAQEISVKNPVSDDTDYTSLGNEGSRRLRALAVWMTLMAYGKKGYAEMVDRDCAMARLFAEKLEASGFLRLMGPVRLNGFAFTLNKENVTVEEILTLRQKIRLDGGAFLNHTKVLGVPAMRCSLSNWGIQEEDVEAVAASVIRCAAEMLAPPENVL